MVNAIRGSFSAMEAGEGGGTYLAHAKSIATTIEEIITRLTFLVVCATFTETFDQCLDISITEENMTRQREMLQSAHQYRVWTVFQGFRGFDW